MHVIMGDDMSGRHIPPFRTHSTARRRGSDSKRSALCTNRLLETILGHLDDYVSWIEQSPFDASSDAVLDDLVQKRAGLKLLLGNRKIEADKPIVDFQKWRDGNGALYLCAATFGPSET
jgi:hypothetical protein